MVEALLDNWGMEKGKARKAKARQAKSWDLSAVG